MEIVREKSGEQSGFGESRDTALYLQEKSLAWFGRTISSSVSIH